MTTTATMDVSYLASYLSLPQPAISAVIDAPTKELVDTLLQAIVTRAKEHDELKAEKLRLDVELETTVHAGEAKTRALKAGLNKAQKDVTDLEKRLNQEELLRIEGDAELQSLRSSSNKAKDEMETLKSRVTMLETSNRNTISLLDSKSTAYDRLADELSAQQQKIGELRRELAASQQSQQAAQSALATAKLRESNLDQELQLTNRSNEWFEEELKRKSAEATKLRKEKNAKIAELQRQNEESTATIESLRRTEAGLRNRLGELEEKVEDSLTKIQHLQEDAARDQEASRKELGNAQRLAELFEASAKTARARLDDVQSTLEQTKDEAAEAMARIQSEAETALAEREAAERKVAELEVVVERMEADAVALPQVASLQGTPQRRLNGSLGGSARSPGSPTIKGGLSFTQMYSEYTTVKSQLEAERRRNQKLSSTIDDMIEDLESKQPEIEHLRTDHGRLEAEMLRLSSLLDVAHSERDAARKEARKVAGNMQAMQHEANILRQQLRDLSLQIQILITEVQARDEGHRALNAVERTQMLQVVQSGMSDEALDGMTDTGRIITKRLTIFKNVRQLQEQNMQLLRVTRELGEKMEGEEAMKKQGEQVKDLAELKDLRNRIEQYKDEMKSMASRSESYLKERDMFRRMLQHRGQLPVNADMDSVFAQSVNSVMSGSPDGMRTADQSQNARDAADMRKMIKEMQSHFDAYREEAATDHRALKEHAERLSRDKGELQMELSKASSQVALARERFEMLQANYNLLRSENFELQKRANNIAETSAKQDLRTQQVAEDLVESRGMVDSMMKEIANMKAEKDLWKRIETRMTEDNERLRNEINRINELMSHRENLQNERELSSSETRRKMQAQLERYEAELQSTKQKLDGEVEDSKKAALRRELEMQQHQKIIDDLRAGIAAVKENLVAAQTSRDHLQARVDQLTAELKAAEDRARAIPPQQVHVQAGEVAVEQGASQTQGMNETTRAPEQDVVQELADLKHELEAVKSELEEAKGQVEQYKAISQSSEEELHNFNETYEEYRAKTESYESVMRADVRSLNEQVEELEEELENTRSELSHARIELVDNAGQYLEERAKLDMEVARLKEETGQLDATAKSYQEDLKAQAEIARQAQLNYENELLKHAEAAKSLQELRREYNQLRTDSIQLRTEAEAARATLSQSESTWEETRQRYEGELSEMKTRRDEISKQNDILHKQLETVVSEIAALRQQRTHSMTGDGDDLSGPDATADRSVDDLREVINFLRRDKEIVDVQYELSLQESKRLRQQLDYAQTQLDECRLKLDQERRAQSDSGRTTITHNELLEKITELNLYRESTVTLRSEARQAQSQLAEKSKQLEQLIEEMQPLRTTIQELQISKEAQEGELKLLQEDRDRWQQRTQNILQKYDTVDPAEVEALKGQVSTLQEELTQLQTEKQEWEPLKQQLESMPEQILKAQEDAIIPWRERQEKQVAQFKERSRTLVAAKNEKVAEAQALAQEKEELERQLIISKQETEAARIEANEANTRAATLGAQLEHAQATADQRPAEDQAHAAQATLSDELRQRLEERAASAERYAQEQETPVHQLEAELSTYRSRLAEYEEQVEQFQHSYDQAQAQMAQLKSTHAQNAELEDSEAAAVLENLRQELSKAEQELESLRTEAAVRAAVNNAPADDGSKTVAQQVQEQVDTIRIDLDQRHAERVQKVEETFKQRAERMKTQLTKVLNERKDQIRQNLEAEHRNALERLTAEHRAEMERLQTQHQQELAQLKQEAGSRFEQAKQQWAVESGAQTAANPDALDMQKPVEQWNVPEPQLRELVRISPVIQGILRSNISTQVKKTKEELERATEAKVNEVMAKADKEKEQAVTMEAQRQKVKLSMAEGKVRAITAKIEVVQKAATESPQQPVGEVWEVAKVAKPGPVMAPTGQAQPSPAPQQQSATGGTTSTPTKAAPQSNVPSQQQQTPQNNPFAQVSTPQSQPTPVGFVPSQPFGSQQGVQSQQNSPQVPPPQQQSTSFNPFAGAAAAPQTQSGLPRAIPASQPMNANGQGMNEGSQQQSSPQLPSTANIRGGSNLPRKPSGFGAGTGPGALRGLMGGPQSMLPRRGGMNSNSFGQQQNQTAGGGPQSPSTTSPNQGQQPQQLQQNTRGQSIGRGRARGRGKRGGGGANTGGGDGNQQQHHPEHQGGQGPQGQGQGMTEGSGSGGGLNASAKQFIPGSGNNNNNKRQRDDNNVGEGSIAGGGRGGKRQRGGAGPGGT
ncbi:MAG: hypothetical protein M1823_002843 [Watsoniomyces obsoletus]|nr:MAG: hypothetical protein M1823_002843 [Watsoniomyces obsoletus]